MPCSAYTPNSDIVLSFVSSYLGSRPQSSAHSQPAAAAPGDMGGSSGSGPTELRTDARLWEVQWPELAILRLIGHGSFGSVYLAEWSRTRVAVKVLVGKGELLLYSSLQEGQWAAGIHAAPSCCPFMLPLALPPQTMSTAGSWSCRRK